MLNSPRFSILHSAFEQSRLIRNAPDLRTKRRVPAFVFAKGVRHDATVIEATGYDLMVRTRTAIPQCTRVEAIFLTSVPTVEVNISGLIHWTARRETSFEIGIALDVPVPDEFKLLHPGCERESIRYQCSESAEVIWSDANVRSTVKVLNYSRYGLCFQTHHPARIASAFELHPSNAPSVNLNGTVRWIVGQGTDFLAGCALQRGLGYELAGIRLTSPRRY
ncbi:MAG: hypothetical protein KDA91_19835 [Planctomycetaceae bacterium]|nr:hypothetical protein [Planctomycetaceae bacterium]